MCIFGYFPNLAKHFGNLLESAQVSLGVGHGYPQANTLNEIMDSNWTTIKAQLNIFNYNWFLLLL